MFEVEFVKMETGELHKEIVENPDWKSAASYCFKLQNVLREQRGGNWKFLKLECIS